MNENQTSASKHTEDSRGRWIGAKETAVFPSIVVYPGDGHAPSGVDKTTVKHDVNKPDGLCRGGRSGVLTVRMCR